MIETSAESVFIKNQSLRVENECGIGGTKVLAGHCHVRCYLELTRDRQLFLVPYISQP
jgi:hypothetical protein